MAATKPVAVLVDCVGHVQRIGLKAFGYCLVCNAVFVRNAERKVIAAACGKE